MWREQEEGCEEQRDAVKERGERRAPAREMRDLGVSMHVNLEKTRFRTCITFCGERISSYCFHLLIVGTVLLSDPHHISIYTIILSTPSIFHKHAEINRSTLKNATERPKPMQEVLPQNTVTIRNPHSQETPINQTQQPNLPSPSQPKNCKRSSKTTKTNPIQSVKSNLQTRRLPRRFSFRFFPITRLPKSSIGTSVCFCFGLSVFSRCFRRFDIVSQPFASGSTRLD